MTTHTATELEIARRLATGEAPESIAAAMGLDYDASEGAVLLPGYVADDGNAPITYEDAESPEDVAEEYVESGDWGDSDHTRWVSVRVWRRGFVARECATCDRPANGYDDDGDPACTEHATVGGEVGAVEVYVDCGTHKVEIPPAEPACGNGYLLHDWRVVSSHGHGGGAIVRETCARCGLVMVMDTWAHDPTDGEQGLVSVRYERGDADE